jgi:hypothetical protein
MNIRNIVLSLLVITGFAFGFVHHPAPAQAQLVYGDEDPLSALGCGPYKRRPICAACNEGNQNCEWVCNGNTYCLYTPLGFCIDENSYTAYTCHSDRKLF